MGAKGKEEMREGKDGLKGGKKRKWERRERNDKEVVF